MDERGVPLKCPACQHVNPERAKFCLECGTSLAARCASCATELPPGAKFCLECGREVGAAKPHATPPSATPYIPRPYTPRHLADRILQSKSALEGERKQVTVLFADVKGSMELAEQLDPETWHQILERFFAILTEGVHRFEGTVNQYTGDGIMALFGAPIAHEDHAERACYAALHLREVLRSYADDVRRQFGLSFAARIGLNSGEVVVGRIGDDLRMDYTAQGHVVGLAQRMEQLAEPGSTFLTAHTAALVDGFFNLRSLGTFNLKGVQEPLGVFALESVGALSTRLDLSRSRGFSKFVGRASEFATLEAALERSLTTRGQTVGIVAEAGTGKSRLCFEFLEHCRARGFAVIEARGVAHGRNVPLLPILQLFRAYFGIEAEDPDLTVREKVAGRLLLLDDSLKDELPIFFDLLGVPDPLRPLPPLNPDILQRRAFAAIRQLVRADATRDKPAIVYFEDLHWLDATSDTYLTQIIEAAHASRGLVLVNFRPEYRAEWMSSPSYQQLPLMPLGPGAVAELLADLLGNHGSVRGLADDVHRRAGGNPFFVEEIVQNLIETGALAGARGAMVLTRPVESLVVPPTVQATLAARIDRLPDAQKQLLQQAAVIGKSFGEDVLAQLAGTNEATLRQGLRGLQAAEFIYEEALYPDVIYAFKHPLTQEVAERSQLAGQRTETHRRVADIVEAISADRLDEAAALIAHHRERSGEDKVAAQWHARAARWIGLRNYQSAADHWRRVTELVSENDADKALIRLRIEAIRNVLLLAFRVGIARDVADALFHSAKQSLARTGDDASLALLTNLYATVPQNAGQITEYLAFAEEAVRIAERIGDQPLKDVLSIEMEVALFDMGRLQDATAVFDAVRHRSAAAPRLGIDLVGYSALVGGLFINAAVLCELGRIDQAKSDARRAIELAQELGPDESRSWANFFLASIGRACGDATGVAEAARRSYEFAERSGSQYAMSFGFWSLSFSAELEKQWDQALSTAQAAIDIWKQGFASDFAVKMLASKARALQGLGNVGQSLEVSLEAMQLADRQQQPVAWCEAAVTQVQCLRALHGTAARDQIDALLTRMISVIDQTGAELWRPHVHEARAEMHVLLGEPLQAQEELSRALDLFNGTGATGHARRIQDRLAVRSSLKI